MVKYIIFDFDGTLVDSKDVAIKVINNLADKYKFKKIEPESFDYLRKLPIMERCKQLNVPIYRIPFWSIHFYGEYKRSLQEVTMFKGIKELMEGLQSRGYQLAIISSNSEENIREFLRRSGIDSIKEVFSSKNIFGKDKVISNFIKRQGLTNKDVIYIGDEQRDIIACKKIGVKVIGVTWGFDSVDLVQKENPDYIAHTPEEILKIVN